MPPEQDHPRHDPVGKVDGIRATSKEKEAPNDIATTPPLEEIRETLTRKLHSLETLLNDNTSLQDGLNSLDRDRFIKRFKKLTTEAGAKLRQIEWSFTTADFQKNQYHP